MHKGVHVREQLGCEWSRGQRGAGEVGSSVHGLGDPKGEVPNHTCSALAFPVSPRRTGVEPREGKAARACSPEVLPGPRGPWREE